MKPNIKKLIITIIAVNLLLMAGQGFAQAVSLDDLIKEAENNNPKIQQAFHTWKAAEYKIKSVKSLPDPMATYGYFGEEVQTRVGPQEQKFGASQKIPFPGKLGLKGKAQAKQAQMLQQQYEAVKNEVIKDVKFVFYDLYWVDKAIEVNEEEKEILEKLENVAQRKYESNLVPQQAVIKAQVELSKIIEKLFLLKQNRQTLTVKMNSLLNRPMSQEMAKISQISNQEFDYTLEDIVKRTNHSRQEMVSANLAVEKAEYEKSLARMNYLPDFTLGAEYIEIGGGTTTQANDGEDAWIGMVSVNVPIWFGKLKSEVEEKKAELAAAQENQKNVANQVSFEAQDFYFKITTYKDIVLLYETALVPQAEQAFDSTQISFETGTVSFLDWLDTERTYLQTRLAYYKAITDYNKSIAFLERVIGGSLQGEQHEK
ncbi:MAG: TolC family protein [Candidatus Omnitrophica bacterium]|nr:TolC family protein [Candidatus Omnitrophota bacterium]